MTSAERELLLAIGDAVAALMVKETSNMYRDAAAGGALVSGPRVAYVLDEKLDAVRAEDKSAAGIGD